ncbi:MAG: VWA domain-containing protein, partial [Acidobacteriaceae bacterium]
MIPRPFALVSLLLLLISAPLPATAQKGGGGGHPGGGGGGHPAPGGGGRPSPGGGRGGSSGAGNSLGSRNGFNTGASGLNSLNEFPTSSYVEEERPRRKPSKDSDFTFKVTTNLVTIDLIATDKSGNIISDLKPEDLEVFDEGKRQDISRMTLENRALIARTAGTESHPAPVLPVKLYDNYSASQNWKGPVTILLMDAANTPFASQAYARNQMLKLLQTLEPQQPIAIYALGRRLTLLQDFTSDPRQVQQAARKIQPREVGLRTDDPGMSSLLDSTQLPQDTHDSLVAFQQDDAAFQMDVRVRLTIEAFKSIARHAEGYPGRKNLVWLSSTFPLEVMSDWQLPSSAPMRMYYQDLHEIGALLSDANVAVYPVDAEGLQVLSTNSAQFSGQVNGHLANGPQFSQMVAAAGQGIIAAHETMNLIAEQTGGRAFYNRNDLGNAIQAAIADGSTYYAIAFTPQNYLPDGRLHELKVKVKRSGVHLRYRKGYFAVDPFDPAHTGTERQKIMRAELMDALIGQQQLSTGVELAGQLDPKDGSLVHVALAGGTLNFVSNAGGMKHASFELAAATFDAKGKTLTAIDHVYAADLSGLRYQQVQQHGFVQQID